MRVVLASISIIPLFVTPVSINGQASTSMAYGSRIRLSAPSLGLERLNGTWLGQGRDTVRIVSERDSAVVAIPLNSVSSIEAYSGQRSHPLRGALVGALGAGLLFGVLTSATFEEPEPVRCDPEDFLCFDFHFGPQNSAEAFWWGFASGVLLGGAAGTVIGAFIRTDRWERAMPGNLDVNVVARSAGQFGLAASLSF